jgi:dolichol-phosphate mannosyltransferase
LPYIGQIAVDPRRPQFYYQHRPVDASTLPFVLGVEPRLSKKELALRLIVAIPVFNELRYVEHVLEKVKHYHNHVLVIDDGSTDGTGDLLAARTDIQLIRHTENRGYGQSIIDSFGWADAHGYDWVITMDCDEQHEPEMIPQFVRYIREDRWDIVSGSRYLKPDKSDDLPPGDRRTINATITALVNETLKLGISDAFCGFKAHRVSAMMPLKLEEPGYAFPMQLWPRAAATNLRITEIPVRLIYNDPTRHFGGLLDDASVRLAHYVDVFNRELKWQPIASGESCSCCCD